MLIFLELLLFLNSEGNFKIFLKYIFFEIKSSKLINYSTNRFWNSHYITVLLAICLGKYFLKKALTTNKIKNNQIFTFS
jgi:hypothetical protein